GRAKLWVTWRALALRRERPELFALGGYHAIGIDGARARNAVAYARRSGASGLVVVAGRLFASLGIEPGRLPVGAAAWGDTAADLAFVPPGTPLANVVTGEILRCDGGRLPLACALGRFPGALLVYDAAAG
ncbi:MAG: malto-oligosyltrehalose synthase, partial [Bacteroidota bacterium]